MQATLASLLLALAALLPFATVAAPVKCVDAKGKVTYMDETAPGADKCQPITGSTIIVPADKPPASSAPVQPDNSLELKRQRIAEAEAKLAQAKQQLADQEAIREGNERNYARVLERLAPYQAAVEAAQKELEQARAER
jgi:hypothetical protein